MFHIGKFWTWKKKMLENRSASVKIRNIKALFFSGGKLPDSTRFFSLWPKWRYRFATGLNKTQPSINGLTWRSGLKLGYSLKSAGLVNRNWVNSDANQYALHTDRRTDNKRWRTSWKYYWRYLHSQQCRSLQANIKANIKSVKKVCKTWI